MHVPDDTDRPPWGVHAVIVVGTLVAVGVSFLLTDLQLGWDSSLLCAPSGSEGTKLPPASPRGRLLCTDDSGQTVLRPVFRRTLVGGTVALGLVTLLTWFLTHRHRVLGAMVLAVLLGPVVLLLAVRVLPAECTEATAVRSHPSACEGGWYDN